MFVKSGVDPVQEQRMLKAAVTETRMAMALTDPHQPDNPIVLTNNAFLEMTGYPAEQVVGRNCRFLQGPDTDPQAVEAIRAALRERRAIQVELMNYRRDGSPFLNELYIKPVFDERGQLINFFASQVDMSPQRQAEALTRATEQRLRLVADELSHRVRNTLSTVHAIVRQTVRNASSLTEVSDTVAARLIALGQAHEALNRHDWERAELGTVVRDTVQPHRDFPGRFRIEGPEVYLGARASLAMAMAIHELCTNAVKYGALSTAAGAVDVVWTLEQRQDLPHLRLQWQESGGPPVQHPVHKGFGTTLIREALAADLMGNVELAYAPTGLVCRIETTLPPG